MDLYVNTKSVKSSSIEALDASFSSCGLYRWYLKRKIGFNIKTMIFVGLNPSTANASCDDSTSRRLIAFCRQWGYGELIIVNLFARISKSPKILRTSSDPVGKKNNQVLLSLLEKWSRSPSIDLWLGWGDGGKFLQRDNQVILKLHKYAISRSKNFPNSFGPMVLGFTCKGNPRHPLYVSSEQGLVPFNWDGFCDL